MKRTIVQVIEYLILQTRRYLPQTFAQMFSKRLNVEELENVLIVVPHPDDDTFGCGMLIKDLCDKGKSVDVVILSKGEAVLPENVISYGELTEARKRLAVLANRNLGLDTDNHLHILDFPDNHFSDVSEATIRSLQDLISRVNPRNVFIPNPWEGQHDHIVATEKLLALLEGINANVYYFCVWMYYLIPISQIFKIPYFQSYMFKGDLATKHRSMRIYMDALAPNGKKISGNLPKLFLKAVGARRELYFKIK